MLFFCSIIVYLIISSCLIEVEIGRVRRFASTLIICKAEANFKVAGRHAPHSPLFLQLAYRSFSVKIVQPTLNSD